MSKDEIFDNLSQRCSIYRNNKGQILQAQQAAKGVFGVDANQLTILKSFLYSRIPQSPITEARRTKTNQDSLCSVVTSGDHNTQFRN